MPTKSFVKKGITKIFCYNNKMFSCINKTLWLLQQNFWLQLQKKIFVVPNLVAVTKPFFSVSEKRATFFTPKKLNV